MANKTEQQTFAIAEPIAKELGLLIYDVEFKKEGADYILRVFIDREDSGVSIEDCENVTRPLKEILDKENIDYDYLEVSSPGIERQLKRQRDFDRFKGHKVLVSLFKAVDGVKKAEGILVERNEKSTILSINEENKEFENESIASVRLVADF